MACSECYEGMECQHCWERRVVREREAARAEVAKLRELLREASGWVFWAACEHGTPNLGNGLVKRIDDALKVEV